MTLRVQTPICGSEIRNFLEIVTAEPTTGVKKITHLNGYVGLIPLRHACLRKYAPARIKLETYIVAVHETCISLSHSVSLTTHRRELNQLLELFGSQRCLRLRRNTHKIS